MGKFRDGMPVTADAVTLILSSIDRIKEILAGLEATETEPDGSDQDLIVKLHDMVERGMEAMQAGPVASTPAAPVKPAVVQGTLVPQTLERPLRPGEVALDELDRAFRQTAIEVAPPAPKQEAAPKKAGPKKAIGEETSEGDRVANQSIRVNVDTLEHLM